VRQSVFRNRKTLIRHIRKAVRYGKVFNGHFVVNIFCDVNASE